MKKIVQIEFKEVINHLAKNEIVYRLNTETSNVADLTDKSIKVINRDYSNNGENHIYFIVVDTSSTDENPDNAEDNAEDNADTEESNS